MSWMTVDHPGDDVGQIRERVDIVHLALFIERQDDGVRRRIDVETDHIAQFFDALRIVREFELAKRFDP
jgi:hypothetical protein